MENSKFQPGRTAIARTEISLPLKYLLSKNLVCMTQSILDYGCGKGYDVGALERLFLGPVFGYDPYHMPFTHMPSRKFDVVLLTYVLDVIYESEQYGVLYDICKRLKYKWSECYISVRRDIPYGVTKYMHADGTYHIQRFVELPGTYFTLIVSNRSYALYSVNADSLYRYFLSIKAIRHED